jgi:aminoglycoside phosphotransferase (APT) family kinase protein
VEDAYHRSLTQIVSDAIGPASAITQIGRGLEHVAWLAETSQGPWVLRVRSARDRAAVRALDAASEVALMAHLRRHGVPWVPEARTIGLESEIVAVRQVPGEPLQDLLATHKVEAAAIVEYGTQLGGVLSTLASISVPECGVPKDEANASEWLDGVAAATAVVTPMLTRSRRGAVDELMRAVPPPACEESHRVLAHNDLGAEHVFIDPVTGHITGIIDWSDAAIADPAGDLGRIWRDLGFAAFQHARDGFDPSGQLREALTERARWFARCLAVENLAFAAEHRSDLVTLELRNLTRVFET